MSKRHDGIILTGGRGGGVFIKYVSWDGLGREDKLGNLFF